MIYMIDLCCDDDLVPYYDKFGMMKTNGMILRNYNLQSEYKRKISYAYSAIERNSAGRITLFLMDRNKLRNNNLKLKWILMFK